MTDDFEKLRTARHHLGGDFVLDVEDVPQAIWGEGTSVLWARGEGLMIAGAVGAGKSTILQQLVLHGIGVQPGPFFDHAVDFPTGPVGYVAADRPSQIRRSMKRMVAEADRQNLNDRLDVWRGPLPFDLAVAPVGALADFVEARGWDLIAIDSLKDVTSGTTDDDTGLAINRQFQELLARGKELVVNHHDRKSQGDGRKRSKTLDDVYGSRWLTAGFGSVLYVDGLPGAEDVTLRHFKQPADEVGPYSLRHDHAAGRTVIVGSGPQLTVLRKRGQGALDAADTVRARGSATAEDVASALGVSREMARRYLNAAVVTGDVLELPRIGTGPSVYGPKP